MADIEESIRQFETALRLDPAYALAYAGLAQSLIIQGDFQYKWPRDVFPQAKQTALRAIELDGALSDAHIAMATVAWEYDWDWTTAEREFQRALALNPNDPTIHQWHGEYLVAMARVDDGLMEMDRAIGLDPGAFAPTSSKALALIHARRYSESLDQAHRATRLQGNPVAPFLYQAVAYLYVGQRAESHGAFEQARKLLGNEYWLTRAHAALQEAMAGRMVEAHRMLAELEKERTRGYIDACILGNAYVLIGDRANALRWLNEAATDRSIFVPKLAVDPGDDYLHGDPQFVALMHRIGLTDVVALAERTLPQIRIPAVEIPARSQSIQN